MALSFVKVTIVPKKFTIIYTGGLGLYDVTIGAITGTMAPGGIWIGSGSPPITAIGDNNCLIGTGGTATPKPIDPPVIYTFCNATSPYGSDFLNLNLKMIRANDYSFNIQVVLNGNPLNCTGGTLRMSAKWKPTDSDANEVFSVSTLSGGINYINATLGTATVTIASALTNTSAIPYHRVDLPYDIQLTDQTGKRFTVAYGTLTILPNISQIAP